jgi:DNA-binding transcriptional MerR regulator
VVNVTRSGLTAAQVAGLCGVRPVTVRLWARRGFLRPVAANGTLRFRPETVLAVYLDRFFETCRRHC